MDQLAPAPLTAWQNFYVILGSSAGALTGLQFVVITLVTQARAAGTERDIRAFGTPTVIHFCLALLISSIMSAPWHTLTALSICLTAAGTLAVVYSLRTIWHARQAAYRPDVEDWIWYTAVPLLGNFALLAAGILMWCGIPSSLNVIGVDALALLFIGVHNAWDTVTFIAIVHVSRTQAGEGGKTDI